MEAATLRVELSPYSNIARLLMSAPDNPATFITPFGAPLRYRLPLRLPPW